MINTLFHHLLNAQTNLIGFSYNINNGDSNPDKGYMVAIKGHEETAPKDCDIIAFGKDYYLRHADQLSEPHYYIGCWYNDGQFVFDISENIQTIEVATSLALHYRQLAIWDCAKGQEYRLTSEGSWLYVKQRLEELRMALRSESISYGELLELQCLSGYIDKGDVELLEASGVEESN